MPLTKAALIPAPGPSPNKISQYSYLQDFLILRFYLMLPRIPLIIRMLILL